MSWRCRKKNRITMGIAPMSAAAAKAPHSCWYCPRMKNVRPTAKVYSSALLRSVRARMKSEYVPMNVSSPITTRIGRMSGTRMYLKIWSRVAQVPGTDTRERVGGKGREHDDEDRADRRDLDRVPDPQRERTERMDLRRHGFVEQSPEVVEGRVRRDQVLIDERVGRIQGRARDPGDREEGVENDKAQEEELERDPNATPRCDAVRGIRDSH